ncbi:hypothetical protein HDU77_003442 [Chytriomyces hyalinus]|nr:hypothetical protein HDU77_003442 [Chytriomyces hyalinus]
MIANEAVVTPNLPRTNDAVQMQTSSICELAKFIPPSTSAGSNLPQQHCLHPRTLELMTQKRESHQLSEELEHLRQFKATMFEELKTVKGQLSTMTRERDKMRDDHLKVIAFHQKENARLRDANSSIDTIRALEKENRRLTDDLRVFQMKNEEMKEKVRDLEAGTSLLRAKLKHASESNELKQKIIMEFEKRVTESTDEVDAKQIAVLREFQAHRLQDLYQKSRRHLEVERKHNDSLRKTLTESQSASLVETLKSDVSALKEENLKLRKENLALKNIQFHHEKEILNLNEVSQRQTIEDLDQEIMLLKMQIQRMEVKEKEQRLHTSCYQSSQRTYPLSKTLSHSRAGTVVLDTATRFPSALYAPSAWNSQKEMTHFALFPSPGNMNRHRGHSSVVAVRHLCILERLRGPRVHASIASCAAVPCRSFHAETLHPYPATAIPQCHSATSHSYTFKSCTSWLHLPSRRLSNLSLRADAAEIARLGKLLRTHKVANTILMLAQRLFLSGSCEFAALPSDAQTSIIIAHSVLGNHYEVLCLYDLLSQVHEDPLRISQDPDFFTAIIKAHSKLKRIKAASKILSRNPNPSADSISLVISGLISSKDLTAAIRLARRYVERSNILHSKRTGAYLVAGLESADRQKDIADVSHWYSGYQIEDTEYLQYYCTAVVEIGSVEAIQNLHTKIDKMVRLWKDGGCKHKDGERILRAFNALMQGTLKAGQKDESVSSAETVAALVDLIAKIRSVGLKPSLSNYTILMYAYFKYGGLEKLVSCYQEMRSADIEPDQAVYNLLIRAYTLENLTDNAIELFDEMVQKRGLFANSRVLTSVMATLTLREEMNECINLFGQIEACGIKPDHALFHVVMNGYAQASDVGNVLAWYNRLLSAGLKPNVVTYTIVMFAISRTADPEATRRWYDRIFSSSILPNVHAYSLLMQDRAKRGDLAAAVHIYKDMLQVGLKPTAATFTTLINAHIVHGTGAGESNSGIQEALALCNEMINGAVRADAAFYHVIMKLFSGLGMKEKAIEIYERMRSGEITDSPVTSAGKGSEVIEPDETMYMSAIGAYAALERLDKVEETLREMLRRANVLGVRKYPPVMVLQNVLYKLSQMLWKRDAELQQKVSDLFQKLFQEFLATSSTSVRAIAPTPELFDKLIRSTARYQNPKLAVMMYQEMVKRGMAGGLESLTRQILFQQLINSSDGGFALTADAFGASIVAGTASEDCKYFEQVIELCKTRQTLSSITSIVSLLDQMDASIQFCQPLDNHSDTNGHIGMARLHIIPTAQNVAVYGSPFGHGLSSNALHLLLDSFNEGEEDLATIPRVWDRLIRHSSRPLVDQSVLLKYVEILAQHGKWMDVKHTITSQCQEFSWLHSMEDLLDDASRIMRRHGGESIADEVSMYWAAQRKE